MSKWFNLDSPLMNGLNKIADIIILNLITLLFFVPGMILSYFAFAGIAQTGNVNVLFLILAALSTLPIGSALTAMNFVALKMVRNEETYIIKTFFRSFKQNFRQASIIWVIYILIIAFFVFDFYIIFKSGLEMPQWIRIGVVITAALVLLLSLNTFPILAKFDNTIGKTLKNAALVGLMMWPKTILMALIWTIPVIILVFAPQILPVDLLAGISGPGFLCALLYNKTFKKFEPEVEEKDADDWTVEVEEEGTQDNDIEG